MIRLTPEQQAEVARTAEPVPVVDPDTGKAYVLISRETLSRLVAAFDGDDNSEHYVPLMNEVGLQQGWGADELDLYTDLDPRRRP